MARERMHRLSQPQQASVEIPSAFTSTAELQQQSGAETDGSSPFSAVSPRSHSVVQNRVVAEGSMEMSARWRFVRVACSVMKSVELVPDARVDGERGPRFEACVQGLRKGTLKLDEDLTNLVGCLPRWVVPVAGTVYVSVYGRDHVVQRGPP